jgi:putative chitinase
MLNNLLDPLREAWGEYCVQNNLGNPALRVSSGIRSKKLNEKVGGSETSSHYIGSAADLIPYNKKLQKFKLFCIDWLRDKEFDQMISENENSKGVPQWIHIGYKRYDGSKRHQFKKMVNNKYYPLS